jgi:hypothetical protein
MNAGQGLSTSYPHLFSKLPILKPVYDVSNAGDRARNPPIWQVDLY